MSGINLARSDGAYMGEEAVYPVSAKNGAYMYRTDLRCLMTKANGTWIQLRDATVANVTELNAIPTSAISAGFRAYQQDIAVLYIWNGSFWTILQGPQPRIRLYRTTGTGYNSATAFFPIPFDAIDTAQTFNPNSDWFDAKTSERRTMVKRPGLYHLHADIQTTVGTTQYLRFYIATAANSTAGINISQTMAAGPSLMTLDGEWRLAANDHVAMMLLVNGSDTADVRNTATGYSVHYMITRISD